MQRHEPALLNHLTQDTRLMGDECGVGDTGSSQIALTDEHVERGERLVPLTHHHKTPSVSRLTG
jgi:hypothetical protein